jgi:hypothetical protein
MTENPSPRYAPTAHLYADPAPATYAARLTDALATAARLAAEFRRVLGAEPTSVEISVTPDSERPEVYFVLDDVDQAFALADLDDAARAIGLTPAAAGEGWQQWTREFDDVDVLLDVWTATPPPPPARRMGRFLRELAAAAVHDRQLDAVLASTAAVGAAVALAARRAIVPPRR